MLPRCLSLLVLLILSPASRGVVVSLRSAIPGAFAKAVQEDFGMAQGGVISLTYSISPHNFTAYAYPLVVIVTAQQKLGWYGGLGDGTSPQSVGNLCGQPSMSRYAIAEASGTIFYNVPTTDLYSVIVMQCYTSPVDIDMSIDGSMVNLRPYSTYYSHLQIQDVTLVRIFEGEVLIFVLFLVGLIGQMVFSMRSVKHIHYFFLAAVVLRIVYTISRYNLYYAVNKTGIETLSQDLVVSVLLFFSDYCAQIALLYLSMGLSTTRTSLARKEVQSASSFLVTYFILGLSSAACTSTGGLACTSCPTSSRAPNIPRAPTHPLRPLLAPNN